MPEQQQGSRWVAIVTGAISVAIGVLYLLLITVLDARGPPGIQNCDQEQIEHTLSLIHI